jgi:hypothetical protein
VVINSVLASVVGLGWVGLGSQIKWISIGVVYTVTSWLPPAQTGI